MSNSPDLTKLPNCGFVNEKDICVKVTVPPQVREVTQLLCWVPAVDKGLPEIQDYQVPLCE